jgi:myo-inositol-1(or 4)-monophosphatase
MFPVLGEEGGEQGGSGDVRWVVDPIDGTTNLARGVPLYCISIALLDRHTGLVGVVYDPQRDELFHGAKGQGAFLGNQPISVSSTLDAATTLFCISHGYDTEDRQRCGELARRLITTNYLLQLGSTALELCYVACGRVDAYISSGEELWDYAAALTLVTEAGGQITNWRGAPWDGSHSYLLAGGESARRQLVQTIGDLQILP